MLKTKPPLDTEYRKCKAVLRSHLENLRRGIALVLHQGRARLLIHSTLSAWSIEDQRDQMLALLFPAHQTKTVERYRITVVADSQLSGFRSTTGLPLLS